MKPLSPKNNCVANYLYEIVSESKRVPLYLLKEKVCSKFRLRNGEFWKILLQLKNEGLIALTGRKDFVTLPEQQLEVNGWIKLDPKPYDRTILFKEKGRTSRIEAPKNTKVSLGIDIDKGSPKLKVVKIEQVGGDESD